MVDQSINQSNLLAAFSYFGSQVLGAKLLQILNGNLAIPIPIQHFEVALNISPGWREDPIKGLISIHDHRHDLNAINSPIPIPIVSIQYPSGHAFCALPIRQPRVCQDGIVAIADLGSGLVHVG